MIWLNHVRDQPRLSEVVFVAGSVCGDRAFFIVRSQVATRKRG
jgi:hypothetical protein